MSSTTTKSTTTKSTTTSGAAVPRRRNSAATSVTGLLAVALAALSFAPIVQGLGWWFVSMAFAAVAVAVVAGGRALGMPNPAAALLGLTAIPLLATAFDGAGLGIALVLPTPASASAVMQTIADAEVQIYQDTIPAGPTPGIVLLIAIGVTVAAVLVDMVVVGYRAPIGGIVVVAALAIVPGKALRADTSGWLLVTIAAALLLMIAADRRRRGLPPRLIGLGAGGAAAVVLALVVQVVLPVPFVDQAAAPPGALFGSGADPLIRLGDDLRRGPNTQVVDFQTTSKNPVYLRLAVLERFTGKTWSPNPGDGSTADGAAPSPPGLVDAPTSAAVTTLTAASSSSIGLRLPLPYPAVAVRGTSGFQWDDRGLTLVRTDTSLAVGSYSVQSLDVDPTASRLATATTGPVGDDAESLSLPSDVPASIVSTADAWTKNASTPYAKALAIQNRLRSAPFTYDTDTPVRDGYNGDGLSVIATFLKVKAGYCVHFASTMAVMARILHIPSRIVVGYQPGTRSVVGGTAHYSVTSDDLHAWPELFFNGIGWVRFEPTPGRGSVPSYAPVPAVKASPSVSASAAVPSRAPVVAPKKPAPVQRAAATPDQQRRDTVNTLVRDVGVGAGLIVLLALPALIRGLRRRRRIARLGRGGSAAIGWHEVLDTGSDLGLATPSGASPRVIAARLQGAVGDDLQAQSALRRVVVAYERQTFGGRDQSVDRADVRSVLTGLRQTARPRDRMIATLAPRSLLGRVRLVATGVQVVTTGKRRRSRTQDHGMSRTPGP